VDPFTQSLQSRPRASASSALGGVDAVDAVGGVTTANAVVDTTTATTAITRRQ
jgi:hypothetical protein